MSNLELGACFSFYGVVAIVSYFFGGNIADRFKPHILISVAMILTGIGGFYLATLPPYNGTFLLYGYWGLTSILLFWSAMIKATRIIGEDLGQGKSFGILDGGRGLVAALIGTAAVALFAGSINIAEDLQQSERTEAFSELIKYVSSFVCAIGVLCFFGLRTVSTDDNVDTKLERNVWKDYKAALKLPAVWLLMGIVLCAYVGYKVTDFFSLYASEIMNYNEVEAANIGSGLLYLRPITGVSVGLLADRGKLLNWLMGGFILIILSSILIVSGAVSGDAYFLFYLSTILIATGVFACRALYFAPLKKGRIPIMLTGTAVGLISVIGYTPDVFMGPVSGYLIDEFDGLPGYQLLFGCLALFGLLGFVLSYRFQKITQ